jgi:Tol biopolymer transport system component
MRRSLPSLLVLGLLAALLVSCGQAATVPQTAASPTASSHAHTDRIAWQGFLDLDQSTSVIFSANADGSDARQLTHPRHGEQDGFPDWSPDGSQILFAHVDVKGTSDVWVMNADGTGQTQLTSCTGVCNGAQWGRWSPDGSKIVYSVAENPIRPDGNASREALWIMNADGSDPVQFTHPPLPTSIADNSPAWSPDGKQILFQSFGSFPEGSIPQLYTIFADGAHLVQVTTNERNYEPAWSPDGTKMIFAHRSSTGVDQNAHLYEMNADGSGLVQITRNPFWQRQPAWGPRP